MPGHQWREYTNCRKGNISVVTCLQQMEEKCNSASHRVVKSVRLTLDILEHFLENYKTLKVIHLIRDPRAIMNSRITTKWFGLNETTSGSRRRGRMNAKALCTRLKDDLIAGVKLKQKYPDRFAFVLFEDLLDDLKTNAVILYSYFNIKGDNLEGIVKTLMNEESDTEHSIRRLYHSYTDWWRFNRNLRITKITEDVCKNVMKLLGYESYETIERRLNFSFQRFDFNPKLLVRHILKNDQYESIFDF
ncbi:Carbohydrate sulfotransferase 1 [Mactra antiquata]